MGGKPLMNILTREIFGNTLTQWLLALIIGLFVYGLLRFLTWLLRRRIEKDTQQPRKNASVLIKALLNHTTGFFFLALAIFTSVHSLSLSETFMTVVNTITITIFLIQLGLWAIEVIEFWIIQRQIGKVGEENYKRGPVAAILLISKIFVWTVVLILIVENIPGVHVTALVASLGIGGIAVAFALQKVLADLFASLSISIDQPFVEGDAINVGEFSGEVEHVGLKSTRIRSNTGEQLIFSNSDLLSSRIRNFKKMEYRLVVFTLNVTYQTSYKKLQKIPEIIKDIIESQPQVTFNRAHFKSYGVSSLIFEIAYTMNTADFALYMDTQQKVNLEIYHRFQDLGINFAYPTQTILVDKKSSGGDHHAEE
jgi:small-conductance mechanosensitive channel